MQLLCADDLSPSPWRNGGGSTRELICVPAGADWRLRVSLADIERDGPFSAFPGVRRHFAVLEGEGVELCLDGAWRALGPNDAPLAFDGAAAPDCRLRAGATRDLNLMLRGVDGGMWAVRPGQPWDADWPWRACFSRGRAELELGDGGRLELPERSLVFGLPPGALRLRTAGSAPAFWLGARV